LKEEEEAKKKAIEAELAAAAAALVKKRLLEEEEKRKRAAEEEKARRNQKASEKWKAIVKRIQIREVVKSITGFKKMYEPLLSPVLGKRKSSIALQEDQINDERYLDLLLQHVSPLEKQRSIF